MTGTNVPPLATDGPSYQVVAITPELAAEWLKTNTHNRNLRQRVVNSYAADMAAGAWVEDGQSIKFSAANVLLDGQHRLSAVVASGATVRMLVVRGLADSTQETMDTGAKRTLGDVLRLRGEDHYVALAAVLVRAYMWQQGARKNLKFTENARPTHRQLLQMLSEHPELRRSAEIGTRVRGAIHLSASSAALCHWLFSRIDEGDCAFFFARVTDGAGLMPGDPVYALRRAVDNLAKGTGRPEETLLTALVIKAWNFYRAGQEIQLLAYRPGGAHPEQYPEPK